MKLGERLALRAAAGHARGPAMGSDREGVLESLRGRMAEILGREVPAPRAAADPAASELPFAHHETPHGVLCRRVETLGASHHVGRIPVEAARDAEPELMALLGLEPALATVGLRGALFLDTETTGLSGGAGTVAFLVGLASFDEDGRLVVEQLFLRNLAEEVPLLARVADRLSEASSVVTYNGKAFDLPLLESRFVMNRLPRPPARPHLDLVHVARRLHKARIGGCSLKAVEVHVLGFERDMDIDGSDVAPRYAHFLRTGDERVLRSVVDHNSWDVVSMAALVGLYGEPMGLLDQRDLVGLAGALQRARAFERAAMVADAAVSSGVGAEALRVRGRIAKARGDRARALADFEALAREVDEPSVRLELAKLYEHFVKEPHRALAMLAQGTGEGDEAEARRKLRLAHKAQRGSPPEPR